MYVVKIMAKPWAKQFYNSRTWKECRKQILRRDHYTCQECMANRAEEIHHIIELSPSNIHNERITLNPDNLISLCKACHSRITDGYTGDVAEGYYFDDEGNVVKR